ncbi:hypothetical protein FRC14_000605 [Serendipita sp. 396]|nr:hypothetical protein FRC14_000605 [Serendipita sp. 396]
MSTNIGNLTTLSTRHNGPQQSLSAPYDEFEKWHPRFYKESGDLVFRVSSSVDRYPTRLLV